MNVIGPFQKILVAAPTQPRKKGELQMIVGIDQAGKQHVTAQVQSARAGLRLLSFGIVRLTERSYTAIVQLEPCAPRIARAQGNNGGMHGPERFRKTRLEGRNSIRLGHAQSQNINGRMCGKSLPLALSSCSLKGKPVQFSKARLQSRANAQPGRLKRGDDFNQGPVI